MRWHLPWPYQPETWYSTALGCNYMAPFPPAPWLPAGAPLFHMLKCFSMSQPLCGGDKRKKQFESFWSISDLDGQSQHDQSAAIVSRRCARCAQLCQRLVSQSFTKPVMFPGKQLEQCTTQPFHCYLNSNILHVISLSATVYIYMCI